MALRPADGLADDANADGLAVEGDRLKRPAG
jgi:hypothetical protein